jgi:hypothetical protein
MPWVAPNGAPVKPDSTTSFVGQLEDRLILPCARSTSLDPVRFAQFVSLELRFDTILTMLRLQCS